MNINETAIWLRQRDRFLILTHKRPDGDTLGCASGLTAGLKSIGKTAYILENPDTTDRYKKMVGKYLAPDSFTPDYIISVDVANEKMFPDGSEKYSGHIDLAIDHHPSNSGYAEADCIYGGAAACGEIIFDILAELCGNIDSDMASSLYTAVSTDTGCFAFANTTADTFRVASMLAKAGAPVAQLNKFLFRTKAKSRMMLEGLIISGMEFYNNGITAVTTITKEMLASTGSDDNDLDDIASIPGAVEGVKVGLTIRELDDGTVKISARTTPDVDANELCSRFGGGGHAMASGCIISGTVESAKTLVLNELNDILENGTAK